MFAQHQITKVRGAKIYAADFRPGDVAWPDEHYCATVLRYQKARHKFHGINLTSIPEEFRPDFLITSEDLAAVGIKNAQSRHGNLFVEPGKEGSYVGQPVAILYFSDSFRCRKFKNWLRTTAVPVVLYDPPEKQSLLMEQDVRAVLSPLISPNSRQLDSIFAEVHYVRHSGDDLSVPDRFSFLLNGKHDPEEPGKAQEVVQEMERLLLQNGAKSLECSFSTDTNDTMFMEPENGMAWWDSEKSALRLYIGTQSPEGDRKAISSALGSLIGSVDFNACPPGGGFGGRDLSSFPIYLAIAAYCSKGSKPVRLSSDRFEQFQSGIKRHASASKGRLFYDPLSGQLKAYFCKLVFNGGGSENLTGAVVGLAALQSAGAYYFPMSAISSFGFKTHGATSGSMRGFGIPQVTFAIESLVDQVAFETKTDPIRLRIGQLICPGKRDVTGYELRHPIGSEELCRLALKEELWTKRDERKLEYDSNSNLYGVGFACCIESFGTSQDAVFAAVELDESGIRVISSVVDMGQGSTIAVAEATKKHLGEKASVALMGEDAIFDQMGLVVPKQGPPVLQNETPKRGSASSASMTAFFHLHAVREASRVLFEISVRDAATAIWGIWPISTTWTQDGVLVADGLPSLTWEQLRLQIIASDLPTGVMVHTYFQGEFATAHFQSTTTVSGEFDGLAIRRNNGVYTPLARSSVNYPSGNDTKSKRTLYAAAGHMVAIDVNTRTGRIKLLDAVSFLDPGVVHNETLLRGQVEGGFAMGVGMALLESLPVPIDGVTNDWNLHRYQVPRARHLPLESLHQLRLVPFEPSSNSPVTHKGVAEATMSTVPAAIANAFFHATKRRLTRLPMLPVHVTKALSD